MSSPLNDADELARTWAENPGVLKAFIEIRLQYEHLCNEVEYILDKRMAESGIEFSSITSRPKSLKSFAEKVSRKKYLSPLKDITDLAGVRLVYLYKTDRPRIEKLIESEFEVIEKVDKVEEQDEDKFGYGAVHFLVHLGRKSSGARYDDLKGLVCEIQVRTVLQDAWAIIAHHLSYKQESDIPKVLKRKLNSLSGLFETADDQFDQVRAERKQYKKTIESKNKSESDFLDQEINLDTFTEFLKWKFPSKNVGGSETHASHILSRVTEYGYRRLSELNDAINRTEKARVAHNAGKNYPAAGEVATAIAYLNPSYRQGFRASDQKRFKEFEHLIS